VTKLPPPIEIEYWYDVRKALVADRCRADGSRTFWATDEYDDRCVLRRWDVVDGAWLAAPAVEVEADPEWPDLIAAEPELHPARALGSTDYWGSCSREVYWEEAPWSVGPDSDALAVLVGWEGTWGYFRSILLLVASGTLSMVLHGDPESGDQPVSAELTAPKMSTAAVIADWLRRAEIGGVYTAAAIRLEALDPDRMLDDDERREWEAWFEADQAEYMHYTYLDLNIDADVRAELRMLLASHETYVETQAAMADPSRGQWLIDAFREDEIHERG